MAAAIAKTIVATGASSGLGFELVKQLLAQPTQAYRFILGARDVGRTQAAYDALRYDAGRHSLTVLPLELSDLGGSVRAFAQQTLQRLGPDGKVDYLLLNAAIANGAEKQGPKGSRWCEAYVVNHLSQHYLVHLLREKLVASKARIVFVSSGAVRRVQDTASLENDLKGGSGIPGQTTYSQTKFVQLLGAHWWRRQLRGQCTVVAVSPGLIPDTGLGRGSGMKLSMDMPDAKTVPEGEIVSVTSGAASILRAFTRDDFPEDPDQIFLTSWGEWWSKDVYGLTLDKALQDKWCLSKEEIEKEEGLTS
ncbi:NAD(P)-binding protein [Canariomyces notabilis]|uniref:NAD(P)-binding protein n=1 Tax=Canariomyces notabilis TaxID=2074819 RepID=A0AAN6QIK0_9PEZI|nr:NAD(P)-binding protein [Canariomyces arenarius]